MWVVFLFSLDILTISTFFFLIHEYQNTLKKNKKLLQRIFLTLHIVGHVLFPV